MAARGEGSGDCEEKAEGRPVNTVVSLHGDRRLIVRLSGVTTLPGTWMLGRRAAQPMLTQCCTLATLTKNH